MSLTLSPKQPASHDPRGPPFGILTGGLIGYCESCNDQVIVTDGLDANTWTFDTACSCTVRTHFVSRIRTPKEGVDW